MTLFHGQYKLIKYDSYIENVCQSVLEDQQNMLIHMQVMTVLCVI